MEEVSKNLIPELAGGSRRHILTVNLEDYYQVGAFKNLISPNQWERFDTRIKHNTDLTLELLANTNNLATFFVSGWIAKHHPEILRQITECGHQIACQGYHQHSIRDLLPEAFKEDLIRAKQTIEDATGIKTHGFRIGRGWLGKDDYWALDILKECAFSYDSSLCPIGRKFVEQKNKTRLHQHTTVYGDLWEVPISSTSIFGWSVPFSGGNYIRQLPIWPIREAAAQWVERREAPLVMYFQIWELDESQPNISGIGWIQKIRHYRNLTLMKERMAFFLSRYSFTSIENYLGIVQTSVSPTPIDEHGSAITADIKKITNTSTVVSLTIIIPCYNEEASINYLDKTLQKLRLTTDQLFKLEFIFVNDGSTDRTPQQLESLCEIRADYRVITHEQNRGIARAILTGFEQCSSEFCAVIDADCTFDPFELPKMMKLMRPNIAAVVASPFHQYGSVDNVPKWRLMLSRGASFLYRCILNHKFSGYTSCFRIYRCSAIKDLKINNDGFCGVTEILARLDLAGHELIECPTVLRTRLLGQSKINLLKTSIDHLRLIMRLAGKRWFGIEIPDPPQKIETK